MKQTLLTATFSILTVLAFAQYSGTIYVYPPSSNQTPTLKSIIDGLEKDGMNGSVTLRLNSGNYGEVSIGEIARIGSPNKKLTIRPISNSTSVTFEHLELDETHYTDLRFLKFNSGNRPHAINANDCQRLRVFDCDFVAKNSAIEMRYAETYTVIRRCSFQNTSSTASGFATLVLSLSSNSLDTYFQDNTVSGGFKFGAHISNNSAGKNYVLDNDVLLNETGVANAMNISSNGGKVWLNRNILISEGPEYFGGGNGNTQPVSAVFFMIGSHGELHMKNNMISGPRKSMAISNGKAYVRHNSFNSHQGAGIQLTNSELTFENNIVKALAQVLISDASTTFTQINNNLYKSIYSSNTPFGVYPAAGGYQGISYGAWKALGRDLTSIFGEPQFHTPFDLHINSNSPAINYGYIVGNINYDVDGDLRSAKADLGADEVKGIKAATINNAPFRPMNLTLKSYPNPSNGQFRITAEVSADSNYEVLDIQGRMIAQGQFRKGFIDLEGIAPGQYLIKVFDGEKLGSTSIIIH